MNSLKKKRSAENGSHNDNGMSQPAEGERRDIARKAALEEAESVLRAVSFAPATTSSSSQAKKKDGGVNNGVSSGGGAEKLEGRFCYWQWFG